MLELPRIAQVQRWLELALQAVGEAETSSDPEIRTGLRAIADDYLALAQYAEAKLAAQALNTTGCTTNVGNMGGGADERPLAEVWPETDLVLDAGVDGDRAAASATHAQA